LPAISGRVSEAEALQELAAEQAALRRVAVLVAEEDSPSVVFAKVAEEARNMLGSVECELWRDEGDGTAVVVAGSGDAIVASFPVGTRVPVDGDGVTALVLGHARPHRIDDYSSASVAVGEGADERGIRSAVGCPIVVRGAIWGAIVVATFGDEPCPPEAERRLGQFAELVATAIAGAAARSPAQPRAARSSASQTSRRR
jgi:GAF domain-containing protein